MLEHSLVCALALPIPVFKSNLRKRQFGWRGEFFFRCGIISCSTMSCLPQTKCAVSRCNLGGKPRSDWEQMQAHVRRLTFITSRQSVSAFQVADAPTAGTTAMAQRQHREGLPTICCCNARQQVLNAIPSILFLTAFALFYCISRIRLQ